MLQHAREPGERIVPGEEHLAGPEPGAQPAPGGEASLAKLLPATEAVRADDAVPTDRVGHHRRDIEPQRVAIGHHAEIDAAVGREPDEVPGTRIDLEELELP